MRALVFDLADPPVALQDVPDARPLRPDWLVTRPLLTGICGSDSKQILLDFGEGDSDNAMSGLCSFPQVMGHEVVAEVDRARTGGRRASTSASGWCSTRGCRARPRGITPLCPACEAGDLSLCWSFATGDISAGIHTGVSSDATGGYAELMPAHSTMLFAGARRDRRRARDLRRPVRGVAAQHHPPPAAARRPGPRVGRGRARLVRGRDPAGAVPRRGGRRSSPASTPRPTLAAQARRAPRRSGSAPSIEMVEELAAWSGGVLRPTMEGLGGLPMCHPGGIDVAYDTVGKPETFEVEVRVLKARGTLVKSGVHAPGRWEWSPLYFKEISWVGSNAFGIEEVEGVRKHGIEHYLDLVAAGRIDLTGLLTHTFGLTEWQDAFYAIADQEHSGAIKVAIDPQR